MKIYEHAKAATLSTRESKVLGLSTAGNVISMDSIPIDAALARLEPENDALNELCSLDFWTAGSLALRSIRLQLDERAARDIAEQVLSYETEQFMNPEGLER